MTPKDIRTVVEMIDSMNRGRFAPAMIIDGRFRNTGVLWAQELEDVDAEKATAAVALLFNASASHENPRPVTIKDFKETLKKIEQDARMARPALPEVEYVREIPAWVKGWVVSRRNNDFRVWPQQKPGYDELQRDNPRYRTYVWSEHEVMPPDEQAAYEKAGARLTFSEVLSATGAQVGADANPDSLSPEDMAALMADV